VAHLCNLYVLPQDGFIFSAIPSKFKGVDTFPVRVMANIKTQIATALVKLIGIPPDGNSSFLKEPALAPPRIRLTDTDGSTNSFCENGKAIINGNTYTNLGDLSFPDNNPLAVSELLT